MSPVSLDIKKLKSAFQNEESQRMAHQVDPLILPSKPPPHFCTAGGKKRLLKKPSTKMLPGKLGMVAETKGVNNKMQRKPSAKEVNIDAGNAAIKSAGHASVLSSEHSKFSSTDWNADTHDSSSPLVLILFPSYHPNLCCRWAYSLCRDRISGILTKGIHCSTKGVHYTCCIS
jgi:hypothetical protein